MESGLLQRQIQVFNSVSDDNCVRVLRLRGERRNSTSVLQRHASPTTGVIVWVAIAYDTRSFFISIHGTVTAQRYVRDML